MRCARLHIALLLVVALSHDAWGNGRFPATVNVQFSSTDDQFILMPATFGLLLSQDGGESFRWVCEDSIGYGGTYDPDYAIHPGGNIYATTFEGLRVSTDGGCSWQTIDGPFRDRWVNEVDVAADGRVWVTTSTGGATNDVYVSTDGTAFSSAGLADEHTWWLSVQSALTNAQRVYLTGYKPQRPDPAGGDPIPAESLLRRTDNGGTNWITLPTTDFELRSESQIYLEAVSPTDPDLVFARVFRATEDLGDAIYRSRDGGANWEKVLELPGTIRAFLLRADGKTAFAATDTPCAGDPPTVLKGCVMTATDADAETGPTWTLAGEQPRMACLGEAGDGTLFACGSNWEPDFFGLATSQTGASWSEVMRFGDIAGPLSCPSDTIQHNVCARLQWPSLCDQLGICDEEEEPAPPVEPPGEKGGCGHQGPFHWLFVLGVLGVGLRRRLRMRLS